jgi:hypothetical protein
MHKNSSQKSPLVQISGSCLDFEQERNIIMEVVGELEWGSHYESNFECSSEGKTMGWDFFNMYFELDFIKTLAEVHPKMTKEEGNILEQQFLRWLEKQFKKLKKDYHLRLVETPYEISKGFKIDPEFYRTEERLWDLR